jgi:large subunit ribosomal protein L22
MTADFRATHRYARIGAGKARPVMELIRGLPAGQALDQLRNDKHRAAAMIHKVLASAVANALQNADVRPNRLVVSQAFVQDGPLLFGRLRFRSGPMGRAMPIRKRTSHLHVHVSDPGASRQRTGQDED